MILSDIYGGTFYSNRVQLLHVNCLCKMFGIDVRQGPKTTLTDYVNQVKTHLVELCKPKIKFIYSQTVTLRVVIQQ